MKLKGFYLLVITIGVATAFGLAISFSALSESMQHPRQIRDALTARFPGVLLEQQSQPSGTWLAYSNRGVYPLFVTLNEDKTLAYYESEIGSGEIPLDPYADYVLYPGRHS